MRGFLSRYHSYKPVRSETLGPSVRFQVEIGFGIEVSQVYLVPYYSYLRFRLSRFNIVIYSR